jgi:hypothetical protein
VVTREIVFEFMDVQVLNALLLKLKVLEAQHSGPEADVGQALL